MKPYVTSPRNPIISKEDVRFGLSEERRVLLRWFLDNIVFSPQYAERLEGYDNARKIIELIYRIIEWDTACIKELPPVVRVDIAELLSPELRLDDAYFLRFQTREELMEAIRSIPYIPGSIHENRKIPGVYLSHQMLENIRAYYAGCDKGLKRQDLARISLYITSRYGLREAMERTGEKKTFLQTIGKKVLWVIQMKYASGQ